MGKALKFPAPINVLKNWTTLNKRLVRLSEEQVEALLEYEKKNRKRRTFLRRLQQRHSRLFATRKQKELGL